MKTIKDRMRDYMDVFHFDETHNFTKLLTAVFALQDAHGETLRSLDRCQEKVHELQDRLNMNRKSVAGEDRHRDALAVSADWVLRQTWVPDLACAQCCEKQGVSGPHVIAEYICYHHQAELLKKYAENDRINDPGNEPAQTEGGHGR